MYAHQYVLHLFIYLSMLPWSSLVYLFQNQFLLVYLCSWYQSQCRFSHYQTPHIYLHLCPWYHNKYTNTHTASDHRHTAKNRTTNTCQHQTNYMSNKDSHTDWPHLVTRRRGSLSKYQLQVCVWQIGVDLLDRNQTARLIMTYIGLHWWNISS